MTDVSPELSKHLLQQMLRIRRMEEKCADLYTQTKIRGFLHLYIGEEAIAAGVIDVLRDDDAVVGTYREHGHALMKGVAMNDIMAEMFGKVTGCSRGRGGSMHLFSAEKRVYGGHAIVGAGFPFAVGLGLADKKLGNDRVTVIFFGEGAVAEGEFHEAMNLAALWKVPVLFCCENNQYAMGTALDRSESQPDIHLKAASYGISSAQVDGMDVVACRQAAQRAVDALRRGEGPQFLEFKTYRFRAHSMFDAELYRKKSEVELWKQRCPIQCIFEKLKKSGEVDDAQLAELSRLAEAEVQASVEFAESSEWESLDDLYKFVHSENTPISPETTPAGTPQKITYREALKRAHQAAMRNDSRVFLIGEDVARYGGAFAVSKGLAEEFGEDRIMDTPLSESGFTGAGIGAAVGGMRPIVEVMTVNFALLALDQIINTASTFLHMSGGQINVPVVIRMTTGAGRQLGAQHSMSLEGWLAHIPGLKVLAPATMEDARGMLGTALNDPDPVLIFENGGLYNMEGTLDENAGDVPITGAAIRRPGTQVSLITYGINVHKCLEAATQLAEQGVDAEVLDLRVLRPLDLETLKASVSKTHRAVIVDDDWKTGGLGAEIGVRLAEEAFFELDAPIRRVCRAEVPMPYARHMEEHALPKVSEIVATALALVKPHV